MLRVSRLRVGLAYFESILMIIISSYIYIVRIILLIDL